MFDLPEPKRRFHSVADMTPYFRGRARQKRICPDCHKAALEVEPTLSPNVGIDRCPACGYSWTVVAPEKARVPEDWSPPKKRCRIIDFEDVRRCG